MPKQDYQCFRCGYSTHRKNNMHKHLYELLKMCPATLNKVDLTDEIKKDIIENRVYLQPPIIHTSATNNNITNITNIQNIVVNMDPLEKLTHYLDFQGKTAIGYGEQIEKKYKKIIDNLNNNKYKYGFELDSCDLLEVIDQTMQLDLDGNPEYINVIYIQELDKIATYHDDEWNSNLASTAIKRIIKIIRDYYLENYEKYLLGKIWNQSTNVFDQNTCKLKLNELYQFYACFDVYPTAYQKTNDELVEKFQHQSENFLDDNCMEQYTEIKAKLPKAESNRMKKTVFDIIKRNTLHNFKILNKNIIKLATVNNDFRLILSDNG